MILVTDDVWIKNLVNSRKFSTARIRVVQETEALFGFLETATDEPFVVFDDETRQIDPLVRLIKKFKKEAPVYVISKREKESDYIMRMLRLGVNDLFFYTASGEIEAILEKIGRGIRSNFGKNVVMLGCQTGATFLGVNMAAAIKQLHGELKVGIVDCDHFKDDVLLRLNPGSQQFLTLNDLLVEMLEKKSESLETFMSLNRLNDLMIVPSGGWNFHLSSLDVREDEYIELLSAISLENDVTFFNLGHSLGPMATAALRIADTICLVAAQEPVALRVLVNVSTFVREVGREGAMRIILNRYRKERRNIPPDAIESIFWTKISAIIPEDAEAVLLSEFERRPLKAGSNPLSSAIRQVAQKTVHDLIASRT